MTYFVLPRNLECWLYHHLHLKDNQNEGQVVIASQTFLPSLSPWQERVNSLLGIQDLYKGETMSLKFI